MARVQIMTEKAIDYLAGQLWERLDGSDLKFWGEARPETRQRYRQYVRDIILKEEAAQ